MDLGSKETQTLIKALSEFKNGPDDLGSLVQALRQKGYCTSRSGAYRYANRILTIRRIFSNGNAQRPSEHQSHPTIDSGNGWKWRGKGAPLLVEINEYMNNKSYSMEMKRQFIVQKLVELHRVLDTCLKYDAEDPSMKNYY